jgi:hypothetical protein
VKRIAVALVGVFVVLVLGYVILVHIALSPSCSLEELAAQSSPDAKFSYSVFRKDCGATVDYVTGVALRPANRPLTDDPADVVLIIEGDVSVQPRWTKGKRLEIAAPSTAHIFRKTDKWRDIDISVVSR